jgi:heme-degrading monooxygenase HmoA
MYIIIWEFRVPTEQAPAFEWMYGPEGDWVHLFRQDAGYLGTELLRDARDVHRYLALDRWRSRGEYERFRARWHEAYAALDQRCEPLTEHEALLGHFERLPS